MHRVAAFLLPSAFIIRCRATRRDECLLPVIYRSLFLLVTHLRSSRRVFPFPLSVRAFRLPGASPDGRTNQLPGWGTLSAWLQADPNAAARYLAHRRGMATDLSDLSTVDRAHEKHVGSSADVIRARNWSGAMILNVIDRLWPPSGPYHLVFPSSHPPLLPPSSGPAFHRALVQFALMVPGGSRERIVRYRDALRFARASIIVREKNCSFAEFDFQ